MLKSQKHVFWEALLVTILIFGLGVFLGVILENWRANKVGEVSLESDLNLLDMRAQTSILTLEDVNCEEAIRKNIEFGDKIYGDAQQLERFESSNRLTDFIVSEHKKYDLLRTQFWINSLKIKEKCGSEEFHTLVYLYDYQSEDLTQKNKQEVFANYLEEVKVDYADSVVLIPIARNMDLNSVELLTKNYDIDQTSILVDETLLITELDELDLIEEYLQNSTSPHKS